MSFSQTDSTDFFEKAQEIASFYGFESSKDLFERGKKDKRERKLPHKKFTETPLNNLSTILQFIFERSIEKKSKEPIYVFHSNIDRDTKSVVNKAKKSDEAYFTLSAIGIEGPYAEALLLSCTNHIFKKLKSKDHHIRINSMGTKEDSKTYFSKLQKTLKKCKSDMSPECKKLFEQAKMLDIHPVLHSEENRKISESITPTLRLLSDNARTHFEEVIEYLEAQKLSYELAPDLVETTNHGVHTIFEVVSKDCDISAFGGRHDTLPYHAYKRKIPVTSITIKTSQKTNGAHIPIKKKRKAKAFLFHTGHKSKLHSLEALSMFCDANIPIAHRLHCKQVGEQFEDLEEKYPFTIIFGEEELENGVVCVRKEATRMSTLINLNPNEISDVKKFLRK